MSQDNTAMRGVLNWYIKRQDSAQKAMLFSFTELPPQRSRESMGKGTDNICVMKATFQ